MFEMAKNKMAAFVLDKRIKILLKEHLSPKLFEMTKIDIVGDKDGIRCHLNLDAKATELFIKEMKSKGLD